MYTVVLWFWEPPYKKASSSLGLMDALNPGVSHEWTTPNTHHIHPLRRPSLSFFGRFSLWMNVIFFSRTIQISFQRLNRNNLWKIFIHKIFLATRGPGIVRKKMLGNHSQRHDHLHYEIHHRHSHRNPHHDRHQCKFRKHWSVGGFSQYANS